MCASCGTRRLGRVHDEQAFQAIMASCYLGRCAYRRRHALFRQPDPWTCRIPAFHYLVVPIPASPGGLSISVSFALLLAASILGALAIVVRFLFHAVKGAKLDKADLYFGIGVFIAIR
jgi:hypothetical protein